MHFEIFFVLSYELVSDESEHTVELLAVRQNFTLRVDGGRGRSMVNAGEQEELDVGAPLFLGGVPPDVARHAHAHWHLRNISSFRGGCGLEQFFSHYITYCSTVLFSPLSYYYYCTFMFINDDSTVVMTELFYIWRMYALDVYFHQCYTAYRSRQF